MKFLKKIFQRKPKVFVLENKYRVVEAFELKGVKYFMFDDAFKVPTSRAMAALTIYEEFRMRVDKDYLEKHIRAMEIILSDPKKMDISTIAVLNKNLKERLALAPMPDYIYRLASVIYFDASESPYSYDYAYNTKKIQKWREADGTLDFFMTKPLAGLMPFLDSADHNSKMYFQVAEKVNELHRKDLQEVLSRQR